MAGDDSRDPSAEGYDPRRALDECYDLWASGAWPDENAVGQLTETMEHVGRLLGRAVRHCLQCKKDLTDVMGCYVFVDGKPVDGLLCVEHGANGANNLSPAQYTWLRG